MNANNNADARPLNLAELRLRLSSAKGPRYWRTLEEIAQTPEFEELLHREFPTDASLWHDPVGRRGFIKVMGASLALMGLTACSRQPTETILPYVKAPESMPVDKAVPYATALPFAGYAIGVLGLTYQGRPTHLEGNPGHPASLGSLDVISQASILDLYDPDRLQHITRNGGTASWPEFLNEWKKTSNILNSRNGAGLAVLTGTVTSPTLAAQLKTLRAKWPMAKWHRFEPAAPVATQAGVLLAFGEAVQALYRFERADVVVSLDAPFLGEGPGQIRYTRDFSARRDPSHPEGMNRLYVLESTPSTTGAAADHRLPIPSGRIPVVALALANALGVRDIQTRPTSISPSEQRWIEAIASDLLAKQGRCLILCGETQPAAVHALTHAMNAALGNIDKTVLYCDPVEAEPTDTNLSFRELVDDIHAGNVKTLVMLGVNPVYAAPTDLNFEAVLEKVETRIALTSHADETAKLCHWVLPEAHPFEAWSDARAYDGTITIAQPLVAPLHEAYSPYELLSALIEDAPRAGYDVVRAYWLSQWPQDFPARWHTALSNGLIPDSALPLRTPALRPATEWNVGYPREAASDELELVFRTDPTVFDGRYANNGWLQETPKPLTKLTWDNAVLLSPATAERLGIAREDIVELTVEGRKIEAPALIAPGHATHSLTIHLGYGRNRVGHIGNDAGFSAYALRSMQSPWRLSGVTVRSTGARKRLALTSTHHLMDGRDLIRSAAVQDFIENPELFHHVDAHHSNGSLYPPVKESAHAWGMSIDLSRCTGCNACVVACQSENNIPVVGRDQVLAGREMHWIRVDHYFAGELDAPQALHQPVLCMHCENAPCEVVCPSAATVHSAEGLNEMVYNRCVGTRYCANNCPYKVRRFNFLAYTDTKTESLKAQRNPQVTVRTRGVMEKCTYCVQRINAARIEAKKAGRRIADGEVVTACQRACPAGAIVFGDLHDPNSRVAKTKANPRHYTLLEELNARPRTGYLGRLRNPNPALEENERHAGA